jgi:hypothetical protein
MDGTRPVRHGMHRASSYEDPSHPSTKMANSRTTIAAIPNAERPQLQIRNPVSFDKPPRRPTFGSMLLR